MVRCSISFENPSDLLKALEKFKSKIGTEQDCWFQNKAKESSFISISRIKNSFAELAQPRNKNENKNDDDGDGDDEREIVNYTYADLKVNVKFFSPHFQPVICEIQFALGMFVFLPVYF